MAAVAHTMTHDQMDWLLDGLAEHRSAFLQFLGRRAASGEDVEDVFQEAVLKAWQNGHKLKEATHFEPWFYTILRHTWIDWSKKSDKLKTGLAAETLVSESEIDHHVCRCGVNLLGEIKEEYSQVLQRVVLEGEAVEALAKELGTTRGNLHVRLHRAREALRKRLERHCDFRPNSLHCACGCSEEHACC